MILCKSLLSLACRISANEPTHTSLPALRIRGYSLQILDYCFLLFEVLKALAVNLPLRPRKWSWWFKQPRLSPQVPQRDPWLHEGGGVGPPEKILTRGTPFPTRQELLPARTDPLWDPQYLQLLYHSLFTLVSLGLMVFSLPFLVMSATTKNKNWKAILTC